jgi:hypothetical protein
MLKVKTIDIKTTLAQMVIDAIQKAVLSIETKQKNKKGSKSK